jgi:enoyl-CoA hydratase/carnithine racemase
MSAESDAVLLVERAEGFATLTLNRPAKRNALSVELRDAISDALDELATEPEIKVVVITGAGPVFSAGFDLSEFQVAAGDEAFGRELWASSDRYHETVLRFPLPTLAAVNGPALAGGFDLAILCDLRIASSTARFAHPERTFGDVVYGPLHDLVGGAIARELTIGGRELTADEALAVHLVGQVVPPEALAHAVNEAVTRIIAAPRDILVRTKAKALARAGYARDSTTSSTLQL